MSVKRIIPCLDVKEGRVVKGVQFVQLRDAGDPVELAQAYVREGADELVFLDISATVEGRQTMIDVVADVAKYVSIPFTVGGGIREIEQMEAILNAGANKVAMSTAAIENPSLVSEGAKKFGSSAIVVAIDAKYNDEWKDWEVYTHGGRQASGMKVVEVADRLVAEGAGEILLTSMDADGTKDGFDVPLTRAVAERVNVPVIASGGAGKVEHFYDVLHEGKADAVLAASVFHFNELKIHDVKQYLRSKGIEVR